ncbi:hypothetical protein GCM10009764_04890 [Nocardia ninae]
MRLVLGEHAQSQKTRVDQVAEDEIDQSIGAAERHRWFGTVRREWKESLALATGEHDPEYVRLAPHTCQTTG